MHKNLRVVAGVVAMEASDGIVARGAGTRTSRSDSGAARPDAKGRPEGRPLRHARPRDSGSRDRFYQLSLTQPPALLPEGVLQVLLISPAVVFSMANVSPETDSVSTR